METSGYVLLCRHARHDHGVLLRDEGAAGRPDSYPSEGVAARLREVLALEQEMTLTQVWYAPTPEAQSTARVIQDALATDRPAWRVGAAPVPDTVASTSKLTKPRWASGDAAPRHPRWSRSTKVGDIAWESLDDLRPGMPARNVEPALTSVTDTVRRHIAVGKAVALVGHSPLLDALCTVMHDRPGRAWLRGGFAIGSGEIVCLEVDARPAPRRWRARLVWQISPDDQKAEEEIREKIKSKMESAKQLSALITLLLTALLGAVTRANGWSDLGMVPAVSVLWVVPLGGWAAAKIAFALLLLALGLYLAAMYAYDSLLMPSRFWGAERPLRACSARWLPRRLLDGRRWLPRRPPASAAWVLNRNMQRIWSWLFQPATVLVVMALLVVAIPLLHLGWRSQIGLLVLLFGYRLIVRRLRTTTGAAD